jgi:hypothetical protein
MATDGGTVRPRARRKVLGAAFAGILLLVLSLYFGIVKSVDGRAIAELGNRVHNVQGAYAALVAQAADAAWNLAVRPDVGAALERGDRAYLERVCREALPRVGASTVAVVTPDGKLFAGAKVAETDDRFLEGPEGFALPPGEAAGVAEDPSLHLVLYAVQPVAAGGRTRGTVVVRLSSLQDHSFVDGVFKSYGLVCSVFRGAERISTTIYQEGKRAVGSPLVNKEIIARVLHEGGVYQGRNRVLGKEYDTVYWPLQDVRGRIVGTIGIGKDRDSITRVFTVIVGVALLLMAGVWLVMTRQSFRLQSLILLAVVPALLLVTCFTGWLLYRDLHAVILEGFDKKLYALSTTISASLEGDRLLGLLETRDEADPTYRRYLPPLREILKAKDVTYLYTFVLGGKKDIVYLIDASPGEFCPIGYEEEVPMQNKEGLRRVIGKGAPYISEIQEYERYGLLKVSAAPIFGHDRSIRALTGVDVTITIIRNKTRLALFEILAVGFVALCLAGLVSFWVSRRLIEPLATVKSAALRLAAGQYDHRSEVAEPVETRALAEAFNHVGETMEGVLRKASAEQATAEAGRRRAELARRLERLAGGGAAGERGLFAIHWPGDRPELGDASGGVKDGHAALVWLADAPPDALAAAAARANIALIVRRVLEKQGSDWPAIAAALAGLFPESVHAFVHWHADRGTLRALVRRPVDALLVEPGGGWRAVALADGGEVPVAPGGSVVLALRIAGRPLPAPGERAADAGSLAASLLAARDAGLAPGERPRSPLVVLEPGRPA